MWSAPNRRVPSSTMRRTSASTATSPTTASASPPAFCTRSTVSAAAAPFRSQTTTRAPSSAKSTEASRPMPIPAPVMRAILFLSLPGIQCFSLDSLEQADQLPVGDGLVVRLLLEAPVLEVVLDDLRAERLARGLRPLELAERVAQRLRHLGQPRVLVGIALEHRWRRQLLGDPAQPRRDGGREGQLGVGVRTRDAVLHP